MSFAFGLKMTIFGQAVGIWFMDDIVVKLVYYT